MSLLMAKSRESEPAEDDTGTSSDSMREFDSGSTTVGWEGDAAANKAHRLNTEAIQAAQAAVPTPTEHPVEKCSVCGAMMNEVRAGLGYTLCTKCAA